MSAGACGRRDRLAYSASAHGRPPIGAAPLHYAPATNPDHKYPNDKDGPTR